MAAAGREGLGLQAQSLARLGQEEEGSTRQLFPYTFMIFKAITSFLRVESSSSCFFFSLCRNWM